MLGWCVVATAQVAEPAASNVPAEQLSPETNPAVLSALELPRTKPGDYLQAVVWLVELGRPELAAPIFQELQALNLTDAQRAELVREHGSYRMLQIARTAELPGGAAFAEACLSAAAAEAHDPARLAKLIDALSDASPAARIVARADLAVAGQEGVTALLEALAKERNPDRRAALADASVAMAPLVIGPLVAMLETSEPALRADVTKMLDRLEVRQAAPLVAADTARDAASRTAAERLLVDAIRRYRRGAEPFASNSDDRVELWKWDDATGALTSVPYTVEDARIIWMARLATRLADLVPDNRTYQRQVLVLGLEAAALESSTNPGRSGATAGLPEGIREFHSVGNALRGVPKALTKIGRNGTEAVPYKAIAVSEFPDALGLPSRANGLLRSLVEGADAALLNDVLADAMKYGYASAAQAAANLLAQRGDASVLTTRDARPSPLADALVDPHRRVRFAALRAIMTLDPVEPFPGSSRVPEALGYFAAGTGERRAIVAMPTMVKATVLAGQLAALGIEAGAADHGSAAVRAALSMTDLEMVLVDMNVGNPGVREVVYQLRATPAAGRVPIALLANSGERLQAARQLAAEHGQVIAAPRPSSEEDLNAIVDRLEDVAARDAATAGERAEQATQAMTWLAQLLDRDRSFYRLGRQAPVVEAALYRLDASESVLTALVALGSATSQQTLADYASQPSLPIASRERAARAFRNSVDQHGVLLAPGDIQRQYDRYNASARADAATQQVLGALLDAIESRRPPVQKP